MKNVEDLFRLRAYRTFLRTHAHDDRFLLTADQERMRGCSKAPRNGETGARSRIQHAAQRGQRGYIGDSRGKERLLRHKSR